MKDPVDHILRPRLPWRPLDDAPITECGYDATKVKTLTRAEYFQRAKDMGRQRTAILTCMTCADTAGRWGTWEDDPRLAMQREIEWERRYPYYRRHTPDNENGTRLLDELVAIDHLISAHREEFDAALREIETRREWNAKKAALEQKTKKPASSGKSL